MVETPVSEGQCFSYHLCHLKWMYWEKSPALLRCLNSKCTLTILVDSRSRQMFQWLNHEISTGSASKCPMLSQKHVIREKSVYHTQKDRRLCNRKGSYRNKEFLCDIHRAEVFTTKSNLNRRIAVQLAKEMKYKPFCAMEGQEEIKAAHYNIKGAWAYSFLFLPQIGTTSLESKSSNSQ